MSQYPYTSNLGRLKDFLNSIGDASVPTKVTQRFLETLGFKSKGDRAFVSILKSLGFLDSGGIPTKAWQNLRDSNRRGIAIADALKSAYKELFDIYPDAHRKDNEALQNFFGTHTTVGKVAVKYMTQTFKTLAGMGDFEGKPTVAKKPVEVTPPMDKAKVPTNVTFNSQQHGLTVNLNIELAIPATDDPTVYDQFFSAMKKHLLK